MVRPLVGHDTVSESGWGATVTVADPVAVTPLASETLKFSVLTPLAGSVRLIVPVPVYGPVSPEAETSQLNGLPAVTPLVGHATVTVSEVPWMVTVCDACFDCALPSVAVNVTVFGPFDV